MGSVQTGLEQNSPFFGKLQLLLYKFKEQEGKQRKTNTPPPKKKAKKNNKNAKKRGGKFPPKPSTPIPSRTSQSCCSSRLEEAQAKLDQDEIRCSPIGAAP